MIPTALDSDRSRGSLLLLSATVSTALAQPIPYLPDVNTRALWHFDEASGATSSADAAGGTTLAAIRDGATLGNASFAGFGLAASTYDSGPGATLAANPSGIPGRNAYLGPLPLVNGTGDNSTLNFTGADGAFTIEALLRVDFDPASQAVAPDTGRAMQIVSADAEETVRLFQFKLGWSGVNDPTPDITFINIGTPIQTITAPLPVSGPNAIASNGWYHVAVTYNGLANTADNFKFYWTKVESNRTQADLLASLTMTNDLPTGSADWTIGNDGRATGGSDQNWVGLIDEVRLSSVARQANQFVFGGISILGASSYQNVTADYHPPEHTLDGDLASRWSALGDGEWIAYDLGRVERVSSVNIAFHLGNTRNSTFDIQLSNDGITWTNALVGAVSSGTSLAPETFDFPDAPARYLRIVGHGNSTSLWNSYTEVEVLSTLLGDSEPDGLPDEWELHFFGNLSQTATTDPDEDGEDNLTEYQAGSDPTRKLSTPSDMDGDGLADLWETQNFGSLDQTGAGDPDGDGYANTAERTAGTNPAKTYSNPGDTDEDGLPDAWEMAIFGSLSASGSNDSDTDGSNNRDEFLAGTDPKNAASLPTDPKLRWVPVDDGNPATSEYARSGGINTASFIRSSLVTVGNQQFMTYYGRHQTDPGNPFNDKLWVARRTLGADVWEVFHTGFTANNITDGHDCISFGIDGLGYMHLSWGMHGDAFHYARSLAPVTGTHEIAFGPDGTMTGKENAVTYPQFMSLRNGDLLYFFREGGSGNGDLFLNRYRISSQTWANVHLSGTNQLAFIKGTGFTPNYNAYWQKPCMDSNGNIHLVWMWRYNSDSPAGESGYQTNHDFAYAWSPDEGVTWKRGNGTNYVLPINERGENGNSGSIAQKVISIPEGSSLINQAGMCVDRSNQPVLASWWAPATAKNDFRRQYMVGFPGSNGWETRQITTRTVDSPATKVAESQLGTSRMGRPVIVCDKDDRLLVVYADNDGPGGLTVVHTRPKALDPQRLLWTQFDLTTDPVGAMDAANPDLERWEQDNQLHIFYLSPSTGNSAAAVGVLEWDAAAYFAHHPDPRLTFSEDRVNAIISFPTQPGWAYRLWSGTDLTNGGWQQIETISGNGATQQITHANGGVGPRRFWRLEIKEGGFDP